MTLPIMTTAQAAARLSVSEYTVRRWCEDGDLRAQWAGSLWAIDRADVERRRRLQIIRERHERLEAV